jgi:putative membrane protein
VPVLVAASVLSLVAALVHLYVFVLESVLWTRPRARAVFGTDEATARTTAPMAFNQGFYNLFLAVEIIAGVVVLAAGNHAVGGTLVLVGTLSMVGAGVVLLASDRSKARPAAVQILPALLGALLLAIALAR